jgi:opacity protein-like surface antigen
MKKRALLAAVLAVTLTSAAWAGDKVDPMAAFEKMKTLAGDWNGQGPQGMATPVSYKVSANGNVVMETLFAGTSHEMITMYHLAGNDLVATHYCAGGNQPHLKLDAEKSTANELVFAFDGGTNIDASTKGYMHGARIAFTPDGHVDSQWEVYSEGKQAGAHAFHLARVK